MLTNSSGRRPVKNHHYPRQPKAPISQTKDNPAPNPSVSHEEMLSQPAYRMYGGAPNQRIKPRETFKWRLDDIKWESHLALTDADYQLLLSVNLVNLSESPVCFSLKCDENDIARAAVNAGSNESVTAMLSFPLRDLSGESFLTVSNDGADDFVLKEGSLKLLALD